MEGVNHRIGFLRSLNSVIHGTQIQTLSTWKTNHNLLPLQSYTYAPKKRNWSSQVASSKTPPSRFWLVIAVFAGVSGILYYANGGFERIKEPQKVTLHQTKSPAASNPTTNTNDEDDLLDSLFLIEEKEKEKLIDDSNCKHNLM